MTSPLKRWFEAAAPIGVVAAVVVAVFAGILILTGDGGLARMTTLSGIYAVERPGGHPVVCFVERAASAMDCVPMSQMGAL